MKKIIIFSILFLVLVSFVVIAPSICINGVCPKEQDAVSIYCPINAYCHVFSYINPPDTTAYLNFSSVPNGTIFWYNAQ